MRGGAVGLFICLFYLYSGYLFQYKVLVSQEVQIKTLLYSTLYVFKMYKSIYKIYLQYVYIIYTVIT